MFYSTDRMLDSKKNPTNLDYKPKRSIAKHQKETSKPRQEINGKQKETGR